MHLTLVYFVLFIECSSDKDCKQTYATCYEGICECKDELIRDGKTCKPGEDLTYNRGIIKRVAVFSHYGRFWLSCHSKRLKSG